MNLAILNRKYSHINNWIFDLDNTLYPPSAALFDLIDQRMCLYISNLFGIDQQAAHSLQKRYFRHYGTTLAGLMADHSTEPHDFLDFVHDIPLDRLSPDSDVIARLSALPGRRIVFTNGDANYAGRVLAALGLSNLFETIYDIHCLEYKPKPRAAGYAIMCEALGINPKESVFIEDMARNLSPAKALGMTTVWINNGSELGDEALQRDHIDYEANSLGQWLQHIMESEQI